MLNGPIKAINRTYAVIKIILNKLKERGIL